MTKPETKRAAKPTRESIEQMAKDLTDLRVASGRTHAALMPALGVDPWLDIAEAEYRAAVEAVARED